MTEPVYTLFGDIWPIVSGSALTLIGVLISNQSNSKRLRIQLEHEAKENALARASALRKDAYLGAVEELTKTNSHLASMPQKDPATDNIADGFQGFFVAAAKLQLVAEPNTALLVNQLVHIYSKLMLKVMRYSIPLYEIRSDIAIHDDLYNKAQVDIARILAEMGRFNETAQTNEFIFASLVRAIEGHQKQAAKYAADRAHAWDKFNCLNIDFCRKIIEEMRSVGNQQIPVLIEIRRDLGLTTNLEVYREQMEEQWYSMLEQLELLISEFKREG